MLGALEAEDAVVREHSMLSVGMSIAHHRLQGGLAGNGEGHLHHLPHGADGLRPLELQAVWSAPSADQMGRQEPEQRSRQRDGAVRVAPGGIAGHAVETHGVDIQEEEVHGVEDPGELRWPLEGDHSNDADLGALTRRF